MQSAEALKRDQDNGTELLWVSDADRPNICLPSLPRTRPIHTPNPKTLAAKH